ncbi:MAG: exodeoxyribonuclease V subunit beta [Ginsengibacter sp.]
MPDQDKFKNFDALRVPLKGSNLIEASAGTGKTYSIAILVLRLILENKFSIKEILMVTFTKAAVAELEERIRLFVRKAYRASQGERINDETISFLVKDSIEKNNADEVSNLLREAILFLDETSVLTIHSFCQQTLNEFAFETNQLFSAELVTDTSAILEDEVNKFWRKNVTTIQTELLAILMKEGLSQKAISSIVKEHLNGKRFHKYDGTREYFLNENDHLNFLKEIKEIHLKKLELGDFLFDFITNNAGLLKQKCTSNSYTNKNNIAELIDDPETFVEYLLEKRGLKNVEKAFVDTGIFDRLDEVGKIEEAMKEIVENCFNQIYNVAISEISEGVKKYKLYNNQLSFDDLIVNLNKALTKRENPVLIKVLQEKYKAVFIDEFQDTDRLQYEIFNKVFGENTVLFYIGDPKQSIYAWRKADIFTYFKAKNDVEERYEMNINFRSTEAYIKAMNVFFLPKENFDTFYFDEGVDSIKYIPVDSPIKNTKGFLKFHDKEVIPMSINGLSKNKDDVAEAAAAQVMDLLSNNGYAISTNGKTEKIKPSDIGILVRNHSDGERVKNSLAQYNIPTVSINNEKVLQSNEAKEILYVLEAMADNTRSNINKALLSSFTRFTINHILTLNEEKAIRLFKEYKITWEKNGVYSALINFITDFEIQKKLLSDHSGNGERIITNLYQLIELLYKNQSSKNLLPLELIDWLRRGIEQKDAEGDELQQRIETDEEAVKIVTIHSSKGLQYKIVIAPYLDFVDNRKREICSFRDSETGDYISAKRAQLSAEQELILLQQNEQENRRLLYVTITRAVYKCYLYRNNYYKTSTLTHFTDHLLNADPQLIEWKDSPEIPENYSYNKTQEKKIEREIQTVDFNLQHNDWQRMSYTMLTAKPERNSKNKFRNTGDDYDHFVFNQLAKGNITGNMLHFIFEKVYFNNDEKWSLVIEKAIKRFAPAQKEKYESGLMNLLKHVLNADILTRNFTFNLGKVDFEKRLHELEFDFPVSLFNPTLLANFSDEERTVSVKVWSEIEGIMNGKIDLFFEHNGKYFVLDWKSTFLGESLDDYSKLAMALAMNENNYHLQYLIYTLAVKKYLEVRLPDFDYDRDFGGVIYCFVRGMRAGSDNGVFWRRPALAEIDKLERLVSQNHLPNNLPLTTIN